MPSRVKGLLSLDEPALPEFRSEKHRGAKHVRLLNCGLSEFPREILDLSSTLEILDLSGNPLSSLPDDFGQLERLKIAFFSDCNFTVFPEQLAKCRSLEMVAFKSNGITTIPEDAFPANLRWLILTNNLITSLPESIGRHPRLEKCMLAGNCLTGLPEQMRSCRKLTLLRLSANKITALPDWLFNLPELAFLSFAGNPCVPQSVDKPSLSSISWQDLSIGDVLGRGASGLISKGVWTTEADGNRDIAIKLFHGNVTSDGSPADEMAACIAAGTHENLIDTHGQIVGHPDPSQRGLVLQLIPPNYMNLGLPPTLQSCTRDFFPDDTHFSLKKATRILCGVAEAAKHLHGRGVVHGDLYAHNVLIDHDGNPMLGDFGAATIYTRSYAQSDRLERMEVLAFGYLMDDLLRFVDVELMEGKEGDLAMLYGLWYMCQKPDVMARPSFAVICQLLQLVKTNLSR